MNIIGICRKYRKSSIKPEGYFLFALEREEGGLFKNLFSAVGKVQYFWHVGGHKASSLVNLHELRYVLR